MAMPTTDDPSDSQPAPTDPNAGGTTAAEIDARLADDLERLLKHANGQDVTVGTVLDVLAERGHAVMIFLLSAPFLINPIPGLSTVFGFAIAILGFCVLVGIKPWLPEFICRRTISHEKLTKLIHGVEWVLKKVERFAKPRLGFLAHGGMRWACGVSLVSLAFLLALPIPIPFNNVPPAIPLVILSFGMLERDGLLILLGHIGNLILWVILFLVGNLLWSALQPILERIGWATPTAVPTTAPSPATQQAAAAVLAFLGLA